ncbi:GntR family transcriptional regulator [Branchiibius hedensis]|uniref:Transcriptional regulator, GntR family n=1 Tax=Branchiibius hedensis TaxID=672460 RepID=A0A2Y8ZS34_9MICO|nr:GntR family transcriptional regulator [Branchiibius hedensis]PWJ25443.1 GntR family transcriptional regulator [Branchiibius hedensis]SSA34256.1 transcriptional regulator, GntR family [Branchiibius hedensis]
MTSSAASELPTSATIPTVLDRDGATPIYIQLAQVLRARIENGEWQPGQRIPSENELNRMYGVSRMTARQVLAQLVNEDLLFRVQGKGTFVAHRKISTRSPAYMGIREQLEGMGYAVQTKILKEGIVPADGRVAEALRLMPGEDVYEIRRIRLLPDDEPISIHTSYVPAALAPGLEAADLTSRQLCVVLESEHGLRMGHIDETLESTLPSPAAASELGIKRSTPLLLLSHQISDPGGKLFEYSRILFRGDKIRLQFHYDL